MDLNERLTAARIAAGFASAADAAISLITMTLSTWAAGAAIVFTLVRLAKQVSSPSLFEARPHPAGFLLPC